MESVHPLEKMLKKIPQLQEVELLFEEIPPLRTAWQNILRQFFKYLPYEVKGINVVEPKWDFLIVLDDCRFDIFKKQININGELEAKIS